MKRLILLMFVAWLLGACSTLPLAHKPSEKPAVTTSEQPIVDQPAVIQTDKRTTPKPNSVSNNQSPTTITNDPVINSAVMPQTERFPNENFWQAMTADRRFTDCSYDPNIESWARRLTAGNEGFQVNVNRMLPYLDFAWREARKREMPTEVAYLPLVESDYRQVYGGYGSPSGWWQLMPEVAKGFRLSSSRGHDERLDPVKATRAALTLMEQNAAQFKGDWLLAIFAYNVGGYRIQNLIKARGKAPGEIEHVSEVGVPAVTEDHLHRLIAWGCIFANPQKYRVDLPSPLAPAERFVEVKLHRSTPVDAIAAALGARGAEWKKQHPLFARAGRVKYGQIVLAPSDLNDRLKSLGDLKRYQSTEVTPIVAVTSSSSASNRVPQSSSSRTQTVASKPAVVSKPSSGALSANTPREHTIGKNESLWLIARRYDMRVTEILALNPKLNRKSMLKLGAKLRLKH
jgi:membrane-bound lytic murein transglycosylase D